MKLSVIQSAVISCRKCPRLTHYREAFSYPDGEAWKKPVPGYGDPHAWLLILGLAPSMRGGNRTGRLFTGDSSGRFLIPALYKAGLANQPESEQLNDGLKLFGCFMTATVKCVPPQNKPTAAEEKACAHFLQSEIQALPNLKAVLALGKVAFDAYQSFAGITPKKPFAHGAKVEIPGHPTLWGSYHPSPQNTHTGKLTEEMLLDLLRLIVNVDPVV